MFAADTVSIERPTPAMLNAARASPTADDSDATVALMRDARRGASLPRSARAKSTSAQDEDRTTKLERGLPSGPMATPNAEVMKRIIAEKERFLPRFIRLLDVTAPIHETSGSIDFSSGSGSKTHGSDAPSPYRLSWIIHLIAQWADPRSFGPLLKHLASPLPYAQDDATWALTRFSPELTVPVLSSIVMRSAGITPHVVDACLLALARTVVRIRCEVTQRRELHSAMESQALASIELILHREQTESASRLLDAASYLAALRSDSGWTRIMTLHEQGVFESPDEERRDIYYLHELYDGRREHGLLADAERDWLMPFLAQASQTVG